MIPKPVESLAHIGQRIMTDLIAKARDDYAMADLAFLATMLSMVGQDFERFAAVHVREHADMCDIFRRALDRLPGDLQLRARAALDASPTSLLASDLRARADVTTRLLIDIHAWVEVSAGKGDAWAVEMDRAIWTVLDHYAESRAYKVAL
jgi:hypothetical protein